MSNSSKTCPNCPHEFEFGKDFTAPAGNHRYKISLPKEAKPADQLRRNIGMLRQWLNEDKIKEAKDFVTNEDLELWLFDGEATALSDQIDIESES